mmetsp:Transcript_17849/g.26027  ORF Transcript_17849/g.26027 Transcript_17849/m.26027 type:complete len:161 (-) Transcript_17849:98-580(-)
MQNTLSRTIISFCQSESKQFIGLRTTFLPASARYFSTRLFDDVVVTKSCAKRIMDLQKSAGNPKLQLRILVEGGGCSGFQYVFKMDDTPPTPRDRCFNRDGAQVVVDEVSLDLMKGATVDYVSEMIRSSFAIINNPNSESACGCGSSFALKNFAENPAID